MNRNRLGFTLVELLVVIAIVAILASILFPVMIRAKAQAKQTINLGNLRQLAVAAALYSKDYNEVQFSTFQHPDPSGLMRSDEWVNLLQPFLKSWEMTVDPTRTNHCSRDNFWTGSRARCRGYAPNTGLLNQASGTGLFGDMIALSGGSLAMPGLGVVAYESPSTFPIFLTTQSQPIYTSSPIWQRAIGPIGENIAGARPRNDGRWMQVYMDTHVRPLLVSVYRAPGYTHLVLPQRPEDLKNFCRSEQAIDNRSFPQRTCVEWSDWLVTNRLPF